MSRFWAELHRRNVIRVGLAYVIGAWLILQVVDVLVGLLSLPDWSLRLIALLLLLGLPAVMAFAWVYELTPAGIQRAEQVSPERSITAETGRRLNLLTFVLALGLIGFVLIDRFALRQPARVYEADSSAQPSDKGAAERASIAVLAFVNMSPDASNAYFSDGVSEEILNVIARLPLRVAARTSSFQFKNQNMDVGEIGRRLGVAHVLEGSVRKADDRVRVTAQLIQVSDGFHLWSESFDRELKDIFAVQTEIAEEIAAALEVSLVADSSQLTQGYTEDLQAYDLYLLGRHHFARRTQSDLNQALGYFERAIEADPGFALAWVGLADTCVFLQNAPSTYGDLSYQQVIERAGPALDRALALQPQLAEAHASRGLLISNGPDPALSIPHFERAIALKPNDSMAHMWYGLELMRRQRYRDAAEAFATAARLDPLTPVVIANRTLPLIVMGKREAARESLLGLIEMAPDAAMGHTYLGFVDYLWGDLAAAHGHTTQAVQRQELGLSGSVHSLVLLALGDFEGASRWLIGANRSLWLAASQNWPELIKLERRLLEFSAFTANSHLTLGQAYMQIGRFNEALGHFEMPGVSEGAARDALFPSDLWLFSTLPALDLAHLYQKLGRERDARDMLARSRAFLDNARAEGGAIHTLDYVEAGYHALDGDAATALEFLERAVNAGWRVPWLMQVDLNLESLRELPKFRRLLDRVSEGSAQQRSKLGF